MSDRVNPYVHLAEGRRYRVIAEFADFDGALHPVGETWIYLGASFLPYDDGLSWFVRELAGREHQIRMQWRDDAQGPIVDHVDRYVVADD